VFILVVRVLSLFSNSRSLQLLVVVDYIYIQVPSEKKSEHTIDSVCTSANTKWKGMCMHMINSICTSMNAKCQVLVQ
jgi:hypothetical protein